MTVHCRLVDAEGVTWDEFDTECYLVNLRVPLPPRNRHMESRPTPGDHLLPTATFNYERTDGGGTRIYRLAVH